VNVAVLIAGIADPKWPLGAAQPRIASPFDESALEVALELRDADPAATITLLVATPAASGDEALARGAAAHRADHLFGVEIPLGIEWDARSQAALWKAALSRLPAPPSLVVMGREFGDRDDGTLPACLAETLGWSFTGLVQQIRAVAGGFEMMRERGSREERIERGAPALASITNDRRNKLRHPLMKNVMAAKRASIATLAVEAPAAVQVRLEALAAAAPPARAGKCRMLEGPVQARVAALADYLRPWRAGA
jgi:electron transfer flavoprotein beta subunit